MNYIVLLRSGQTKLVQNVELKNGIDQLNEDGVLVPPEEVHRHMLKTVAFEPGVTIRSILTLVAGNKVLQEVLSNDMGPFLEQAFGPEPSHDISGGIDPADVEYASLYRYVWRDRTETGIQLSGLEHPEFVGLGPVLEKNEVEHGVVIQEKGTRPAYGFSMTSVRLLLDIPVQLDPQAVFSPTDIVPPDSDKQQGEVPNEALSYRGAEVYEMPEFKLVEVLEGMMAELCYISKT